MLTWRNVPGYCDFSDIYQEMVLSASDGAVFVEIGVLFGRSTTCMASLIEESRKRIRFDAIDKFQIDNDLLDEFDRSSWVISNPTIKRRSREVVSRSSLREVAEYFAGLVGVASFINFISSRAQDRVEFYADNSLDFVFIDADHSRDDTEEIIRGYLPKVKPGGVLGGHDYVSTEYREVSVAVDAILGKEIEVKGSSFLYRKKV